MTDEDDDIQDIWATVRAPPQPKSYVGHRSVSDGKCHVRIERNRKLYPLPLCLNVMRHSPDGFEWGYAGSGPAQLALAILCDHFGKGKTSAERALRAHQHFKSRVIVQLAHDDWTLTSTEVEHHVQEIESLFGGCAKNAP